MLKYNLYFRSEKINKRPISEDELNKIREAKNINKYNSQTRELEVIPTNQLEIIKCYVI